MDRQPLVLEVTPATYDELAGLLNARPGDPINLGGIELQRGPIPPLMLSEADIDSCYARSGNGKPHGFARLIEFHVIRRLAQQRPRR